MKRIVYLAYYFRKMNWALLHKFIRYARMSNRHTLLELIVSMVVDSLRYNISPLEYFQFGFFEKSHKEKLQWAGTGFMYEYQLKMNPESERGILNDKRRFAMEYAPFLRHEVGDLLSLAEDPSKASRILGNASGKIVFKAADGKCGAEVLVADACDFTPELIGDRMRRTQYNLIEEFIVQHEDLNALSPSAVNTVRIFTQLNSRNEVEILGCRLRISVNSKVDNMAAGNMAAPIDEGTGKVIGPGVYSDITKPVATKHPVTGVTIPGFQVPYWPEVIDMVKKAALLHPQNRSIGWDIVVTKDGPGLIEGNHDWCKLLWQLPVQKGLKPHLLKYL